MHVGEKPYVVTASGHAELAANALTVGAMTGMLDQLLPAESRKTLNELGAVEYHLPTDQAAPATRYSVVAARGGNDIWIEVRRRKVAEEPVPVAVHHNAAVAVEEPPPSADVAASDLGDRYGRGGAEIEEREPEDFDDLEPVDQFVSDTDIDDRDTASFDAPEALEEPAGGFELKPQTNDDFYAADHVEEDLGEGRVRFDELPPAFDFTYEPDRPSDVQGPALREIEESISSAVEQETSTAAAIGPVARVNVRLETPAAPPAPTVVVRKHADPLHHLLHVAAAHGASALYAAPEAKPSLRVDGEIRVLDEAPLTREQLETGLRALLQSAEGAPLPIGEIETREVADVGRVQYLGFRDHRGIGAMFRMLPGRAISSEQAGLSAGIQALCTEPEGLLLVAGGRSAGKSTLVAALVDQINRTRRDHVITVESEIQYVHGNRTSFISQREARDDEGFADAVRGALREAPDVVVIDGAMNAGVAAMALQAAADGHFVVASITAPTTGGALQRFISLIDHDTEARGLLSEHLRGVVTQALLRKTGGGRAAAREVLVNVPSIASLVAGGQFEHISSVINSGRRVGMVPLNDALVGLVQTGALDVRQAYRKSPEPGELLDMLKNAGFDTTFAERLS
jgi:twitching motility protein PilT